MAQLIICDVPEDTVTPRVTIPSIGVLRAFKSQIDAIPSPADLSAQLLAQAGPVLAPIMYVVRIVQILLKIYDTFKSVKNPYKLRKNIKKLAALLKNITAIVPGIAYVRLTRDIIDLIAAILNAFASLINRWITEIQLLAAAMLARDALDDPEITIYINCSKERLVSIQAASMSTLQDIMAILDVITQLLDIIKSFIPGNPINDVINVIQKITGVPVQMATVASQIDQADSPSALLATTTSLRTIANTLDEAASALSNFSAKLSGVVGISA